MKILVVQLREKPCPILDAEIVPEDDYKSYANRCADLNRDKNRKHDFAIEEHPDDSLIAFLAQERHYDMSKFANLTKSVLDAFERLSDDVQTLRAFADAALAASDPERNA